jgi:hypothetical protein
LEKRVDKNEKLLNKTQQNDKKNVEIRWSFDLGLMGEGGGCLVGRRSSGGTGDEENVQKKMTVCSII